MATKTPKNGIILAQNRADDDSLASTERFKRPFWTVQALLLNGAKQLFHPLEQLFRTVLKECFTQWNSSQVALFQPQSSIWFACENGWSAGGCKVNWQKMGLWKGLVLGEKGPFLEPFWVFEGAKMLVWSARRANLVTPDGDFAYAGRLSCYAKWPRSVTKSAVGRDQKCRRAWPKVALRLNLKYGRSF